ncbi:type VII secretion protein EccB [Streptomyces kunmingensis]|uniref:Type VII secretion protein EccB n=1 Tax=Streptomyces kunmingensis TaxID=68225 RepID=A0ABU6CE62_9ACTN|nr:type VII secretion protein EccB [Streptomyces kunmingensis]MEB3962996.1 type VII secretion protein EccB [Streptomyces kunmingensis]
MQTRRDQVQAHQFVVSRLTTGLQRGNPDEPETPTRRTNRGVVIGALIGVLVCIGSLVYGFVRPGGATSWRDGKTLIVEKSTGTRYLYDGALRPVLNYASARLIIGPDMTTDDISTASLEGVARGTSVGIEGAPDALPSASQLNDGPWEVCAGMRTTDGGESAPTTSLIITAEGEDSSSGPDGAILVQDSKSHDTFLLWHGSRFEMAAGNSTRNALGYSSATPLMVSATFLNALPAGPDLKPPSVSGQGGAGPRLDGEQSRIGQVFTVDTPGSAQQYYLLQRAGLVPLTATQAALALSGPGTRDKAYDHDTPALIPLSADALNEALAPASTSGEARNVQRAGEELPASPPKLTSVPEEKNVCARLAPRGKQGTYVSLVLADTSALAKASARPQRGVTSACLKVDALFVPPSRGSLVRALGSAGGAVGSTTYLITDSGVKYRIPTAADAELLGVDLASAQALPSPLLRMLPTGPDLTQAAALAGHGETGGDRGCADDSR